MFRPIEYNSYLRFISVNYLQNDFNFNSIQDNESTTYCKINQYN